MVILIQIRNSQKLNPYGSETTFLAYLTNPPTIQLDCIQKKVKLKMQVTHEIK
jgi:hypothetical protein